MAMKTLLIYALSAGSLLSIVLLIRFALTAFAPRRNRRLGKTRRVSRCHLPEVRFMDQYEFERFHKADRARNPELYVTD